MILSIPDMSCGHCKAAVTEALGALDPSAQIQVDLESRQVELNSRATEAAVIAALDGAGYTAKRLR